jgi:hypothetical protein
MLHEPIRDGIAETSRDRSENLLRAGRTNGGGCGMSVGLRMLEEVG